MAIEFVCGNCSKTLRVPDEHLGKKARCPNCSWINVVEPQHRPQAAPPQNPTEFPNHPTSSYHASPYHTSPHPTSPPPTSPHQSQAPPPTDRKDWIDFSKPTVDHPYAPINSGGYHPALAPHRGGLVLTLGIVSLFLNCWFLLIPGILAWSFGRADLKRMKAGTMNREGESITLAGMILGIIGTLWPLLGIALVIFMSILGAAMG